jgi:hypothetical protein
MLAGFSKWKVIVLTNFLLVEHLQTLAGHRRSPERPNFLLQDWRREMRAVIV